MVLADRTAETLRARWPDGVARVIGEGGDPVVVVEQEGLVSDDGVSVLVGVRVWRQTLATANEDADVVIGDLIRVDHAAYLLVDRSEDYDGQKSQYGAVLRFRATPHEAALGA